MPIIFPEASRDSIDTIAFHFRLNIKNRVPSGLIQRPTESIEELRARYATPVDAVAQLPAISQSTLSALPDELRFSGFGLVEAFSQERLLSPEHPFACFRTHMVWKRNTPTLPASEPVFAELCRNFFWRVRILHMRSGVLILVLDTCTLAITPKGKPVKIWSKDAAGKRVGESRQRIRPEQEVYLLGSGQLLIGSHASP